MWAYHENVPIAVTAWEAALAAYDNVVSTSIGSADDVLPAIPVETTSTASVQKVPAATSSQKYAGGNPLNRGEIETWVIELTNEERISAGLQPFRHDAAISDIARSHSENMARLRLMRHDIGGSDPTDRAMTAGYNCRAYSGDGSYTYGLSENVAEHPRVTQWMGQGRSYHPVDYSRDAEDMARELVQGWMSSPGHRENILDRDARRIGVGVAIQESPEYGYIGETVYSTQNFSACE